VQPAPARLEVELGRKLDEPGIVGSKDTAEITVIDVSSDTARIKLGVVEQIVEFEAQLQTR
jgi:hypothetical protein